MNHSAIKTDPGSPATPELRIHRLADDSADEPGHRFLSPRSRLVVHCDHAGLAQDYCRFLMGDPAAESLYSVPEPLSDAAFLKYSSASEISADEIVVFTDGRPTKRLQGVLNRLALIPRSRPISCLLVLTSLRSHMAAGRPDRMQLLLDQLSSEFRKVPATLPPLPPGSPGRGGFSVVGTESDVTDSVDRTRPCLIVIRTGYVLNASSAVSRRLTRLRSLRQGILPRLTTTFVDGSALFTVIGQELAGSCQNPAEKACPIACDIPDQHGTVRQLTLLGVRRSWHSLFPSTDSPGRGERLLQAAVTVISACGVPWLLFACCLLFGRLTPAVRQWHFHTLKPRSLGELLSLCNRHNWRDVQIAGYNNGVNHFGWKFPDRTVVLTTGIPGNACLSDRSESRGVSALPDRIGADREPAAGSAGALLTVDAGLTLNYCIQELRRVDREFLVVPNYTWISMGTLFFVPVHGSGSRVSTLGDTIEDVLLYDCEKERFVAARRGEATFREWMYHPAQHRLLLRLTLRVQPKSRYLARRSTLENPSAEAVQELFADPEASHVEIRRNRASSTAIDVCRYYVDTGVPRPGSMEIPRDSIGRIWDRLEETPVVSALFHWLVRTFAFHVELFLRRDEFLVFWNHLPTLPVAKIQLRRMLKDGLPHSACAVEDCISADLFMARRNRDVFCEFVTTCLPHVRSNPGKQSL